MPKGKREKKIQAQERKNQFEVAEAEPHGEAKDFGKNRKVKINRAIVILF